MTLFLKVLSKISLKPFGNPDFHIQVDTLHTPQNLVQNKVLKHTSIDKTLKKIRDELLEGKSFSVELEWVSRHCNAVANSFATWVVISNLQRKVGLICLVLYLRRSSMQWTILSGREKGFLSFFDEETYRIWDKDAGFPKGFRDILLRTFRNRVIIPSEIDGSSTSFETPQFNIVGLNEIQKLLSNQAHNVKLWDFKTSGPSINLTWNDDSIPKSP